MIRTSVPERACVHRRVRLRTISPGSYVARGFDNVPENAEHPFTFLYFRETIKNGFFPKRLRNSLEDLVIVSAIFGGKWKSFRAVSLITSPGTKIIRHAPFRSPEQIDDCRAKFVYD